MSHYIVSYRIVPYHIIYHVISYQYHIISISYRTSYHIPCHITYPILSYPIISYHIDIVCLYMKMSATHILSTFPIVVIFFGGCVPEVLHHHAVGFIYIPGQLVFISFITAQFYDVRKCSGTLRPDGRTRLFAHYITSSLSLRRRMWKYWTSKKLLRYILSSVYLILSQFPQLSSMQYMGLCVFSLPIYLMMIVRISVLYLIVVTIKTEVWPICQCVGLGHATMVCAVCLSILLPLP